MGAEHYTTHNPAETIELGQRLAERLKVGDCVALNGPLGAGKTVLVRGIARGLGLADERMVSSPTYVLVQEYAGRLPIYHLDLYRMRDPAGELADLALEEMLADGVLLVEWADRAAGALPKPRWQVDLEHAGRHSRRITVTRVEQR